jgi:hypothetical protein
LLPEIGRCRERAECMRRIHCGALVGIQSFASRQEGFRRRQ